MKLVVSYLGRVATTEAYERAREAALAHIPRCPACKAALCPTGDRLRRVVVWALAGGEAVAL